MKRCLVLAVVGAALAICASAAAHPLGNFTINRYSRVEPSGDRVYVLYVLDLAEIPTFQAKPQVHANGEAAYASRLTRMIGRHLELTVNGRRATLTSLRHVLAFPPGQAGLRTTRLEIVFAGPRLHGKSTVVYHDNNYASRIGWREIVVQPAHGADVLSSSAPSKSVSDELLSYPKNLLQSPLDVASARTRIDPGSSAGIAPTLLPRSVLEQRVAVRAVADGGFASLIARDNLSVGFVLVSLLIAMFWGAAHAFSPGHGKSIVAAYLVGSRGTPRHAVFLGLTVTVTHTIGVFALGLITLSLSAFIVPDQLYPWLNLVSALLIVAVGLSVLRWRIREWRKRDAGHAHGHSHSHGHHHHGHDHEHDHALSARRLLGIGISGGIIPCPTALVVLLAAISLHRVGYGLVLILAFSVGLAAAMTAIGILAVSAKRVFNRVGYGLVLILAFSVGLAAAMTAIGILAVSAKRVFNRVDFNGGLIKLLPAISALVVLGLGLAMTVRALPHLT